MTINRTTFFSYVRNAPFGGRLSQAQIDGMTAILNRWEADDKLTDKRWLAYMLATVFHETAQTMQPVRETLAKSDAQAIARLNAAYNAGKLKSVKNRYWVDGYFGRGLVQLTHEKNYDRMGMILGIPLRQNPSLALDMKTSVDILFEGMTKGVSNKGDFTKYSLEDYFNGNTNDPKGARRIINGTDKAELIAQYHGNFLDAITKAEEVAVTKQLPPEVSREDAKPDDKPPAQSKSLWAIIVSVFGGGAAAPVAKDMLDRGQSFVEAISNPYQLASLVLILVALGVGVWLLSTGRLTLFRNATVVK